MLLTLLGILLILFLVGGGWGYSRYGAIGFSPLLVIVIVLIFFLLYRGL